MAESMVTKRSSTRMGTNYQVNNGILLNFTDTAVLKQGIIADLYNVLNLQDHFRRIDQEPKFAKAERLSEFVVAVTGKVEARSGASTET